jgi:hypothetical protein
MILLGNKTWNGQVIYNGDKCIVIKLSDFMATSSDTIDKVVESFGEGDVVAYSNYNMRSWMPPRFPQYVYVSLNNNTVISKEELKRLTDEILNDHVNRGEFSRFLSEMEICMEGPDSISLSDNSLFFTFIGTVREDDEKKETFILQSSTPAMRIDGWHVELFCPTTTDINDAKATLTWKNTDSEGLGTNPKFSPAVIYIGNHYETICVPFDLIRATENLTLKDVIEKVVKDRNLSGRSASNYYIYAADYNVSQGWNGRVIPFMTIDEMKVFFGSLTRNGTKLETFCTCCEHFSSSAGYPRYALKDDVGKRYVFEFSSCPAASVPGNQLPLDFVLVRLPYCRVIATEETTHGEGFRLIVEIARNTTSEALNCIYSLLENRRQGVFVTGFTAEDMSGIISMIQNKEASNVT